MTSEEAKQKMCIGPCRTGRMVLLNADANPPYQECEQWERRCVGSDCMAWTGSGCGFVGKDHGEPYAEYKSIADTEAGC